jgi:hypothetical protein
VAAAAVLMILPEVELVENLAVLVEDQLTEYLEHHQ